MDAAKITDYIVLCIPEDWGDEDPDPKILEREVFKAVVRQYERMPKALLIDPVVWHFTSDPDEVERIQPAHDCEQCRAGNEMARQFLIENPGRRLAIGDVTYTEVWRD